MIKVDPNVEEFLKEPAGGYLEPKDEEFDDEEEIDVEEVSGTATSREVLNLEARMARRLARKPDVSRLQRAVDKDGNPLFDKGTRVVVERRITFLSNHPWLDTCVYTVLHTDLVSGVVTCLDEEHGHKSFLSYKDGHHDWYLAGKGNPLAKKRTRRHRNVVADT